MIFHSAIEPIYFLLPVIGLVVGLFATVLGGGGGFFFLPVLTLVLDVPAQTAVITSLVATLPIGFVGVLGHHKKGNVDFRMGAVFSIFGVVGAFAGAYYTSKIDTELLQHCFGIYTWFLAINIIYGSLKKVKNNDVGVMNRNDYTRNIKSALFGFFGGTISGSFGTSVPARF